MSIKQNPSFRTANRLTRKTIWDLRDKAIQQGFESPEIVLLAALMGTGKSYGIPKWAAQTGNQITVFAPRHDVLDEYEKRCDERGLSYKRLGSFHRHCESLSLAEDGEPKDELTKEFLKKYNQGQSGKQIHEDTDQLYPCQEDGPCEYMKRLDLKSDNYDVLLGTYIHAYSEDWIEGRYVVIDEFPGDAFIRKFNSGFQKSVTRYVAQSDQLTFRDYEDLIEQKASLSTDVQKWIQSRKESPVDFEWEHHALRSKGYELAPLMTLAALEYDRLDNRWWFADLGANRKAVRNPRDGEWAFLLPPNLEKAESILALDGTPCKVMWEQTLGSEVVPQSLLNPSQKRAFLHEIQGLRIIEASEDLKPYQGGKWVTPRKDLAILEWFGRHVNMTPGLITSKDAISQYQEELPGGHCLDDLLDGRMNFGGFKGSNNFETTRAGIITGAPFVGDDVVEMWAAFAGKSVERLEIDGEKTRGSNIDFDAYGNQIYNNLVEDEVLQAVMRFGRKEENGEKGATVCVLTSALPDWVETEILIPSVHSWLTEKNGMQQVIEAIQTLDGWRSREWKTKEVAETIEEHSEEEAIGKRSVLNHLKTLTEQGYLKSRKGGQGGAYHFSNRCLEEALQYGHVELSV